jgi:hypothetical protein
MFVRALEELVRPVSDATCMSSYDGDHKLPLW